MFKFTVYVMKEVCTKVLHSYATSSRSRWPVVEANYYRISWVVSCTKVLVAPYNLRQNKKILSYFEYKSHCIMPPILFAWQLFAIDLQLDLPFLTSA